MCLILFAVLPDPDHRLVVAANRDEQYSRPSAQANWWPDFPHVLGGRDLEAGGTWLGISRTGRFAAVTNFREDPPDPLPPRSRGELTAGFLTGGMAAESFLRQVHENADEYRGFNLVLGDDTGFYYYSNRDRKIQPLPPGYYGLSNQLLDCDWPKVIRGRKQLSRLADAGFPPDELFGLLFCQGDGAPFSQSFIATETYGTSASTVITVSATGSVYFEERSFRPWGEADRIHRYRFGLEGGS